MILPLPSPALDQRAHLGTDNDTEENDGGNDDTAGAGAEQVQQSKPFLSLGMAW